MSAPTVNLTVTVNTPAGAAVSGAIVTATLSAIDFYDAVVPEIVVQPVSISATANGSGLATLTLFPNALGNQNTFYEIEAWTSDLSTLVFRTTCVLPNAATDLATIWGTVPAPTYFDAPPGPPSVVHIVAGGTGAGTPAGARANLGIDEPGDVLHVALNLSDVASKSTSRANLGVAIGVDVQSYDANTAKLNAVQSWTKAQRGTPVALTSASNAIPVDMSLSNNFSYACVEDSTLGAPSSMVAGQSGAILGMQHASSAKTLAFNGAWIVAPGGNGTITTTLSGKFMILYSTFDSGTVLYDIRNLS